MTIYEQFIEYLKKEQISLNNKQTDLEKHHILPFHAGGTNNGPVVLCTSKNHTLAHYYRYLAYGQKGDFIAFTMRWRQKIGQTERTKLAVAKNKLLRKGFFDPEWQRQQGKKGGKVKKNSLKLFEARRKIGKLYGRKTGLKNQSSKLKTFLSKTSIWVYKKNNVKKTVIILPKESFIEFIFLLEKISGEKITKSSFYRIVYGERKTLYGWSLVFLSL
jgi:hypothetical protein